MGRDYVPSNDQQYEAWLANFVAMLTVNASAVGLAPADLTAITAAQDEFTGDYETFVQARMMAKSATGAKNTARAQSEEILRPLVQRIQKHPGMTDQLRALLGLTQQYIEASPIPLEDLMPNMRLEAKTGAVMVHWGTEPANEHTNGKPMGVKGANIYRKKAGDDDYQVVGFATVSPYIDRVMGPATDYTYVVRYRGTKQFDLSLESDPVTIAARGELAA